MNDIEAILNEQLPFIYRESDRISIMTLFVVGIWNFKGLLFAISLPISLYGLISTWFGPHIFGLKDLNLPRPRNFANVVATTAITLLYTFLLMYSAFQLWHTRVHLAEWLWIVAVSSLVLTMYVGRILWTRSKLAPLLTNPVQREELRNALLKRLKES